MICRIQLTSLDNAQALTVPAAIEAWSINLAQKANEVNDE